MCKSKHFFILLVSVILANCKKEALKNKDTSSELILIENIVVLKDSLQLDGNTGVWYYKDQLFSGYSVRYYKNGAILEKVGFYNGKKEGDAKTWFVGGEIKTFYKYKQNVITGSYKAWWENGTLQSEANYVNGHIEGVQKKYYATGVLSKKRNLVHGKEVGLQQAWLENGTLYVNYEAKNGRVFGLRRTNSCYQLENEKVIRYDEVKK